ncbi:MAG TPA: hypothetical protein VI278_08600 [Nitrososphaeraceae archaeon]
MAISVAFFGLGVGSLLVHLLKDKIIIEKEKLPSKILQTATAFAISVPVFLFLIGHVIPSNTSFIYIFYLVSSIPFFFAGMSMALVYIAMPKEISKLYFVDLLGAALATLILDPLLQTVGAEAALISIDLLVIGPSLIAALLLTLPSRKKTYQDSLHLMAKENKIIFCAIIVFVICAVLITFNQLNSGILAVLPGESKMLRLKLTNPSDYEILSTQWNSFSRIDVTRNTHDLGGLAWAIIDGSAATPIVKWNGSTSGLQWVKKYMDYLPYEISRTRTSLIIGSGGGEDILIALAGGSQNVTAVELNPLIVSAVKRFGGNSTGNLYDRQNVQLFVDDGRHFISSADSKYDKIVIKLVDSWAAQLAGGYALSENYLYTVEAFKQYLSHLNENNGMLVMVRWNFELPTLVPLVAESLRQHEDQKGSIHDISKQVLIVEDRPGLFFGSKSMKTPYPVLMVVKKSAFTGSEINLIKERITRSDAKVIAMPGGYIQPPYDKLLLPDNLGRNNYTNNEQKPLPIDYIQNYTQKTGNNSSFKIPTDDSPFYFAREKIPSQLRLLLETAVGVCAALTFMLIYFYRHKKIHLTKSSSPFHIAFVIFIGFGFMFLEITFIQKFLLLLGTPIMALTITLFSILLCTGIGAYLSGRLFSNNPNKALIISLPLLTAIILLYYSFIGLIINTAISLHIQQRIALTFTLLCPPALLMGFQFPSITKIALGSRSQNGEDRNTITSGNDDITLLWGVNVIASVIGTVLTTVSSIAVGFNGNLLIGLGLYLGALTSAIAARRIKFKVIA